MLALKAAGHTVVAVAPLDDYASRISAAGIEFKAIPLSGSGTNPWSELRSVIKLLSIFTHGINGHRIDMVLSYTPKGNLYSALACQVAGMAYVPNISGLGRAFIKKSMVTLVVKALYRLTMKRALHVFFQNNEDMASFVEAGLVKADRAERLPGSGVDLKRFQIAPWPAERSPNGLTFLLVCRMMWDKGVGEYVEAARQVRTLFPNARFQLLGFLDVANPSAISRQQMNAWEAEGIVTYFSPTDDVRPFMANADCVVLPSYREGVPRTLLEAGAMARPVITTDAPGCRDTVLDGKTGFLCHVANAQDLAQKIMQFILLTHEQRQEMGRQGRIFVENLFDEQIVLDRYLQLVKSAEGRSGRL